MPACSASPREREDWSSVCAQSGDGVETVALGASLVVTAWHVVFREGDGQWVLCCP